MEWHQLKEKNQGGLPPCKRSAVKRNTSTRRQAATSRAAQADLFTSDHRERLHPPSLCELWRDKQVSLLWSSVKMSRLHCITPWQGRKPSVLSEERLSPREEKTSVFVRHFFYKKMADPSSPIRATPGQGERDSTRAKRSEREHRRPEVEKRRATHIYCKREFTRRVHNGLHNSTLFTVQTI